MGIKKLRISNFKTFKNVSIELDKYGVLIGANASGKSNFIQIFKFLRDIVNYGLENAISLQGGIEYLRNLKLGSTIKFSLGIVADAFGGFAQSTKGGKAIGIETNEFEYYFSLAFKEAGSGYDITADRITQQVDFVEFRSGKEGFQDRKKIGPGKIIVSKSGGKFDVQVKKPDKLPIKFTKEDIFPPFFIEEMKDPKSLLIERGVYPATYMLRDVFDDVAIYDFDPKLPKKAVPFTGKAELEEDGSNLALVLNRLIRDEEKQRKLSNLIKDVLPFVNDLAIEKFADKSLLFKLSEKYIEQEYLPASLISDGTINVTALIVGLFFETKALTIIEEPERNVHPSLISKMVGMMRDASNSKQIIVTTHNPEIVKHAGLENLYLVSRDREGFSRIYKPSEKEELKIFLENEMGIDELYAEDLLNLEK